MNRCLRPLAERAGVTPREWDGIWFQHDGAPPHTSALAQRWLGRNFPRRYIGRGGVVDWPPRSPDLNPLDFGFWGILKSHVYREKISDIAN